MPWDDEVSAANHCRQGPERLLKQVVEKVGGKGGGTRDFARLNDGSHAEKAVSLARELLPVS